MDLSHEAVICLKASGNSFTRGFFAAFGLRAVISILGRVLEILKKRPSGILSFSSLLGEKHVVFRVEAIRLGLFIGSFSSVYHLLILWFAYLRSKRNRVPFKPRLEEKDRQPSDRRSKIECYCAGAVAAGISVSFLSHDSRRTLALYSMARAFQSIFYHVELKGFWKSILPVIQLPSFSLSIDVHKFLKEHLDSIVFAVSSAQIMYSYVMNPETLPSSYWKFIVRTGPIPQNVLTATRHVVSRDYPVPLKKIGLNPSQLSEYATLIPCSLLHPNHNSCVSFGGHVLKSTVKKSWLMYLYLNSFSYFILGLRRFLRSPGDSIFRALLSTTRSTIFLAFFVTIYGNIICLHRKTGLRDSKFIYWLAGIICSSSILIEKKARREELGLYVFPRAVDSLWLAADIKSLPRAEILIYAISMGFLVYYNEYHPKCLAPLLRSIFNNVLPATEENKNQMEESDNEQK